MANKTKRSGKSPNAATNAHSDATAEATNVAKVTSKGARANKRAMKKTTAARKRSVASSQRARTTPRKQDKRTRYTDEQRQQILATARRDGLTGDQVAKKFGISTVTYYLWRKAAGSPKAARGRRTQRVANGATSDLAAMVRSKVRAQIQQMLPEIVRAEIAGAFGESRRR